ERNFRWRSAFHTPRMYRTGLDSGGSIASLARYLSLTNRQHPQPAPSCCDHVKNELRGIAFPDFAVAREIDELRNVTVTAKIRHAGNTFNMSFLGEIRDTSQRNRFQMPVRVHQEADSIWFSTQGFIS